MKQVLMSFSSFCNGIEYDYKLVKTSNEVVLYSYFNGELESQLTWDIAFIEDAYEVAFYIENRNQRGVAC